MKISFIVPSRNNLKYLKWSYAATRKNQGDHTVEICVADDASTDGTWAWCVEMERQDPDFKWIRNEGPNRLGHTILYDRLINEVASHDICMIYHADMYLCPGALDAIEKHIGPKKIVSLTRIEPPLHPSGPEKIIRDFGTEPELFKEDELIKDLPNHALYIKAKATEGIFAPWAFMKSDFQEIGGHDPLYAPQSKEDSDIFNRFQLNGVSFVQTWQGFVYHMTCRGSRFNPTLTTPGQNSPEWEAQNLRSTRNFIRKWGHFVKHDEYMKPIIPPKYNIGIIVHGCALDTIYALEPWCNNLYIDKYEYLYNIYQQQEGPNTKFNLNERIRPISDKKSNDIIIELTNTPGLLQRIMPHIQEMSSIIQQTNDIGQFSLGEMTINIFQLNTYEHTLIKAKI